MENSKQPAFGYAMCTADGQSHIEQKGLTKREYFAGLAMQSLINKKDDNDTFNDIAKWSSDMADALLERLNKK